MTRHAARAALPVLTAALLTVITPFSSSAQWTNSVDRDQITGSEQRFASSPATTATERMAFPYGDTRAWLGVGCDGERMWSYIGFSNPPNLVNTNNHDGYETLQARFRWDDDVAEMRLQQDWGSSFLHFGNDRDAVSRIMNASSVLVEVPWYGNGAVYFRFSLAGSTAAIARLGCPAN